MSLDAYYNSDNMMADGHANWVASETDKMHRELVRQLYDDFERFPLPICFDPAEELKQLNLRTKRIKETVSRMLNIAEIRFNKKHHHSINH